MYWSLENNALPRVLRKMQQFCQKRLAGARIKLLHWVSMLLSVRENVDHLKVKVGGFKLCIHGNNQKYLRN